MKIPRGLGACADLLYKTREARLKKQKEVEVLEAEESELKKHIIDELPKSEASGVAGKVARVSVTVKGVPQVKDWEKFYAYVYKNRAFELLQRRLSRESVEERMEEEGELPGVEVFRAPTVSLSKV